MNKELLFILLTLFLSWVVLGEIYGDKPLTHIINKMLNGGM